MRWMVLAFAFCLACGGDDDGGGDGGSMLACSADEDCDNGRFCDGQERCDPDDPSATPLGCVFADSPCEGNCDEDADECESECADNDGDGAADVACGGTDCDDTDPNRYPGNTEVCDLEGVDEDCDDSTYGDRDLDEDGFFDVRCCNGSACGEDCDETRRGTNPNVPEVCDGRDNDCDGAVDEELLQAVYADEDRDLQGDPDAPLMACPGRAGTSASSLDCDDNNPMVNSAQSEFTDSEDNDCDDLVDEMPVSQVWYRDADGDGYGDPNGPSMNDVSRPSGYALLAIDCDDNDGNRSPRADELCNGIDDDCDGEANYEIGVNDWEDDDGDGVPDSACATGPMRDCDDTDPATYTGAWERCDLRDNDCDGTVDEDCSSSPPDAGTPDAGAADGGAGFDAGGLDAGAADAGVDASECFVPADCNDGEYCNGMETCSPSGQCEPGVAVDCDDANATTLDTCDDFLGTCINSPTVAAYDLGAQHTCAVLSDGRLYCWGATSYGNLGMPPMSVLERPTQVGSDADWIDVSVGSVNTCGIRNVAGSNQLYCWGYNDFGQVGDGTRMLRANPTFVSLMQAPVDVSVHTHHTCALDDLLRAFCWGSGIDGQLGLGGTSDELTPTVTVGTYDELAVGTSFTCARIGDAVDCWGTGTSTNLVPTPMSFSPAITGTAVRLTQPGYFGAAHVLSNGSAFYLPHPDMGTPDSASAGMSWTSFCSGEEHHCGVRSDGTLWCRGMNSWGQLGTGTTLSQSFFVQISSDTNWASVECGRFHTCALNDLGQLFCWGADDAGQRGDGNGQDPQGPSTAELMSFN